MKVLITDFARPEKPIGCECRVSDNSTLLEFYTSRISLKEEIFIVQKGIRHLQLLKNPQKVKNVFS